MITANEAKLQYQDNISNFYVMDENLKAIYYKYFIDYVEAYINQMHVCGFDISELVDSFCKESNDALIEYPVDNIRLQLKNKLASALQVDGWNVTIDYKAYF